MSLKGLGPQTVYDVEKAAGKIKGIPVKLANTYTNQYVDAAKKLEGLN